MHAADSRRLPGHAATPDPKTESVLVSFFSRACVAKHGEGARFRFCSDRPKSVAASSSTLMAESTDDTIEATFVWGADCDPHGGKKLTLHMLESELAKRDPDGKSTIAAKMRFTNSLAFEMAPTGPSDDEYMCAQACSLEYIPLASLTRKR